MKILKYTLLLFLMTALLCTTSLFLLPNITIPLNQNSFLNRLNCNYIATYQGETSIDREFHLLNSVYNIDNNRVNIKADLIMQSKLRAVFDEQILCKNEIAVSENLLNESLNIGDTLTTKSYFDGESRQFKVVNTIKSCFGLLNESPDMNKGIVIFGYDETVSNTNHSKISFVNNEKLSIFGVQLDLFISVKKLINENNLASFPFIVVDALVKLFIVICYFSFFSFFTGKRIRKNIVYGLSVKQIFSKFYLKNLLPLALSITISTIILFLISWFFYKYAFYYLFLYMVSNIFLGMAAFLDFKIKMRGV